MPHSTTETVVNGDSSPSSKTLSHFTSYPTVASGIDTFKANPYGKKSIELVNGTYARFGKPVEGYLETPYQYAKPYVNKADELGDKALETVDGHFPIVKEKPETIYETGKSWVFWPYTYAVDAWNGMFPNVSTFCTDGLKLTSHRRALQNPQSAPQPSPALRPHLRPALLRLPRHLGSPDRHRRLDSPALRSHARHHARVPQQRQPEGRGGQEVRRGAVQRGPQVWRG